jgi:hypothetical protein
MDFDTSIATQRTTLPGTKMERNAAAHRTCE